MAWMGDGSNATLMARLNRDAEQLAARFQLRYRAVEAERPNVKRRYGVCFSDGTIRIRLRHVVTRKHLKYSSLVNTLCHELAHLRHFNHGPRFKVFYLKILEYARTEGIYQPGPPRETPARLPERPPSPPRAAAEQLSLF
jgi:predicted metal-dependent hydrolase